MNDLQKIILEQIEEYKAELHVLEISMVRKYESKEDYQPELNKIKIKKVKISQA